MVLRTAYTGKNEGKQFWDVQFTQSAQEPQSAKVWQMLLF